MILSHFLRFQYNGVCFNVKKLSVYIIVFVWSQYDGGNIEQWTIGYGCHQNQEAKLKIVEGYRSTVAQMAAR